MFQLGRFWAVKGPGLITLIPLLLHMVRADLRTVMYDVPTHNVIARVNVSVKGHAVLYLRVIAPERAIIAVAHYVEASSQLAQTEPCARCSASTNWTTCWPNASASTSISSRCSPAPAFRSSSAARWSRKSAPEALAKSRALAHDGPC